MPRPSFEPTDQQRKLVKSLSAMGHRHEDICLLLKLGSPKTLRKHLRKELSTGMAEANAAVAHKAYDMAKSGRFPAMTYFWMKCHGRLTEQMEEQSPTQEWTTEIRFTGKQDVPNVAKEMTHAKA